MANQLDLSELSVKQLVDLTWELRGTPQVQPVYRELSNRPARLSLRPDDPHWEEKLMAALKGSQSHAAS